MQLIEVVVKKGMTSMNKPDSTPETLYMDKIVTRDVIQKKKETIQQKDMQLSREFPNREAFRKARAKYAIYNNFALQHKRTDMKMVTARYTCQLSLTYTSLYG